MTTNLLLLISGNAETICRNVGFDAATTELVKIEEKTLASPGRVLALLRRGRYAAVAWGCKSLEFQRFQPFMNLYLLLSSCKRGALADEFGAVKPYRALATLGRDVPLIAAQLFVTVLVALFSYIRLPLLKRRLSKR